MAKEVATAIGVGISSLRDLKNLVPTLINHGEKHVERGVLVKHYPIFGDALINTLKAGLH